MDRRKEEEGTGIASLSPTFKKGKVSHALPERRWGAHLPLIAFEPIGG